MLVPPQTSSVIYCLPSGVIEVRKRTIYLSRTCNTASSGLLSWNHSKVLFAKKFVVNEPTYTNNLFRNVFQRAGDPGEFKIEQCIYLTARMHYWILNNWLNSSVENPLNEKNSPLCVWAISLLVLMKLRLIY